MIHETVQTIVGGVHFWMINYCPLYVFFSSIRPIIGTVQFVLGREIDSITLATSLAHLRGKEGVCHELERLS